MIICVCRGLSDRQIAQAIADGVRRPGALFAAAGCKPQCGSCLAMIRTMMAEAPAEDDRSAGYFATAAE
jgi:bacterioferritin-associated ferredoxin